ncbi:Molybdenum-pterin-binding protein MopA [Saezia sanguinis]|uniref:Molybdenum-pterin-binding protein MopA n=2 Tax=Saezia sanguinis TaxID=1965230 RepID=A0A433S9T4_9BURK|nr:Molybdenum-pterin-binding protein MopA [Saezia sanguinis]
MRGDCKMKNTQDAIPEMEVQDVLEKAKSKRRSKPETPVKVRWRMRVLYGDLIAIGPGKVSLLEAVRDYGSITAAAKSLGMSYRRAWLLLNDINSALASPAIVSSHGGASGGTSQLTEVGEQVIALYRQIEQQASAANQKELSQLLGLLK